MWYGVGQKEEGAEDVTIKESFEQPQPGPRSLCSLNPNLFHVTEGTSKSGDF